MLKYLFILLLCYNNVTAQELFVMTEPASNMPAKSIGLRVSNYLMRTDSSNGSSYHFMPELMIAPTKNLMLHIAGITSTRLRGLNAEGFTVYGKYRLISKDDLHKHFRVAAFGRYSSNNSPIHMHEINLPMHNSGYELGGVATQLLHKTALSGTVSWQRATSSNKVKFPYPTQDQNALFYAASFGQLIHPKVYTSYKQTNVNVMVEFLGQYNMGNQQGYIDVVPSVQAIFNSVARLDIGFRKQLSSNMHRSFTQGFIFKLEYLFFNALK